MKEAIDFVTIVDGVVIKKDESISVVTHNGRIHPYYAISIPSKYQPITLSLYGTESLKQLHKALSVHLKRIDGHVVLTELIN